MALYLEFMSIILNFLRLVFYFLIFHPLTFNWEYCFNSSIDHSLKWSAQLSKKRKKANHLMSLLSYQGLLCYGLLTIFILEVPNNLFLDWLLSLKIVLIMKYIHLSEPLFHHIFKKDLSAVEMAQRISSIFQEVTYIYQTF